MKVYATIVILFAFWCEHCKAQITIPKELRLFINTEKEYLLRAMKPTSEDPENVRLAKQLNRLQPRISNDVPFPCTLNNTRSKKRPKSVHKLRPGDIDVIGAIGDSLTAGTGLVATNILHIMVENRGLVFSIGGQGTWRQSLTLPNILKEFNPSLKGYSLADSFGHQTALTRFNVAEPGAISKDTPAMAKLLIKRMKDDPSVDFRRDWKMVSYMIGSNDVCSVSCFRKNPEDIIEEHKQDVLVVLRMLRDHLPRTVVNLILSPNVTVLTEATLTNKPGLCRLINMVECSCLFMRQEEYLANFQKIMFEWQRVEMEVANYAEFDREDFTVIAQPFAMGLSLPLTPEGLTDYSSFSEDCFHLSQKGGAQAALSLWNNILEPVGNKSAHQSELFNFKCPTSDRPFIFTRRNSLE